ncbi:hypothetical protein [Dongia sp.]|uniref:hypothetical protein n=1 Tax=Dongia sp. TaxID=1977262 RepID=UPI0035AEACB6
MASVVDICNLALGHLADDAEVTSISPADGSAQAGHCARFYPIARDALLALHDWTFAKVRKTSLAEVGGATTAAYPYAYALPSGIIKPIKALRDEHADEEDEGVVYKIEGETVLAKEPIVTLICIGRVTNTDKFPPLFVTALSWLLASYLCGPILKELAGGKIARQMYQQFQVTFGQATGTDANLSNAEPTHTPGWIGAR